MNTSSNDPISAMDKAQAAVQAAVQAASAPPKGGAAESVVVWTPSMVQILGISILLFTLIALFLGSILLWRNKSDGIQVLRVLGVLSIVGLSAFLLVVGYSNEQLTPIVGLFGAIAGYLIGKDAQVIGIKQNSDKQT